MSTKPAWQATLDYDLVSDPHVTGKHGFEIIGDNNIEEGIVIYESGLVYSTRGDAVQAAEDVSHFAWQYRAWHERGDEEIGGLQKRQPLTHDDVRAFERQMAPVEKGQ